MINKNILFVDDNNNVISGIQRQLRPYRGHWQLFFLNSGEEALQLMATHPIDLIVTDIMMPLMRGDDLLKKVSLLYPNIVRIILSGYADEATLKSGLDVAHQYLSKPCSAETLREAILHIFNVLACVQNPCIIAEMGDPKLLPSLPKIYHQLNAAISNDNTSIAEIAEILARDMVLSAKLLQVVNSAYFGVNRNVSSLVEAINLIGLKHLNNLVITAHVKNAFPVKSPAMASFMEYIWEDANDVATLAKQIALSEDQLEDRPDQAYMCGLLHNMGLLMFLSRGGDQLVRLLDQVKNTDTPVAELETEIYGVTRSEAAAYILSLWKIPPRIIEGILLQHNPSVSDYDGVSALTAVHVASCLLKPKEMDGYERLFEMKVDSQYLERINKLERLSDWQLLADELLVKLAE
jgi:HD-like signal output (HDOD) protein/ActR/RegA family two-component response regulator